ncbi:LytR C-terminal domain-containing protein [Bifidobacterium xylocopae]|uniref:Cell wall integrity and stress response protein 1 n=1 Tax=Bifidobacterium xylocopae TaxID=2493119 RepID=A0A366KFG9_9BIFI|nr:LytR C-terminal domain-containing protein [Bifidobacterium xylocopae]RBP99948.1 cell wall integrity and stress response protein 1 [Bifidobacterium xylocopae]
MASNRDDNVGYQPYTPDEFDDPPEGPVGVHRGPRSLAVRILPVVVIIILAALCGLGAWTVVSGGKMPWQHSQTTSAQVEQARRKVEARRGKDPKSAPSRRAKTEEPKPAPQSPSPSQSEQPAPAANKASQVRVVNGTSISGYAAAKRQTLVAAGYTSVTADNPTGQLPQASVVWYQNEADKATADDVARTLGIGNVQHVPGASASVVAVLMN